MIAIVFALLVGSCYGQLDQAAVDQAALDLFSAADLNHNGEVTLDEMMGEFTKLDANGNSKESRHEFTEFICHEVPEMYNLGHYLYDALDLALPKHMLTVEDYTAFFYDVDTNGDDVVTESEYTVFTVKLILRYTLSGGATHHETFNHGHSHCH